MRTLLKSLLWPRDLWAPCTPLSPDERLAAYERRLGRYYAAQELSRGEQRARQRLRDAAVRHVIDQHSAQRVQTRIVPRLPA